MPRRSKTSSFGTQSRISHDASQYYESKLYSDLPKAQAPAAPDNELPADMTNRIVHGSAEQMTGLPDNCVHLMVTSTAL
jgi:hypothetical protein